MIRWEVSKKTPLAGVRFCRSLGTKGNAEGRWALEFVKSLQ